LVGWPGMRRLGRIVLNMLTILSLLLCLAAAGLCGRRYWRADKMDWTRAFHPAAERPFVGLASSRGGVTIHFGIFSSGPRSRWVNSGWDWDTYAHSPIAYPARGVANRFGFGLRSGANSFGRRGVVVFPAWLPTAVFAALPLVRGALFVRRRRRVREGCCRKCGYDLRATPDRCPECGAEPGEGLGPRREGKGRETAEGGAGGTRAAGGVSSSRAGGEGSF
jgi:hypothetical protein